MTSYFNQNDDLFLFRALFRLGGHHTHINVVVMKMNNGFVWSTIQQTTTSVFACVSGISHTLSRHGIDQRKQSMGPLSTCVCEI